MAYWSWRWSLPLQAARWRGWPIILGPRLSPMTTGTTPPLAFTTILGEVINTIIMEAAGLRPAYLPPISMVAWAPMSSSTVATGALGTTMTITGATIRRNVIGASHPLHVGRARRHGGMMTGAATRSPHPLHLLGGRRGGMIVGPAASPRPLLVGRRCGMMTGAAASLPPLLGGRRCGMMTGAAASLPPLLVGHRGGMITGLAASRLPAAAHRPAPNPGHRRDPDPHSNWWTMIRIQVTGHCPVLNRAGGLPNLPNSGRRGMGCPVTGRRLA